MTPHLAPGMPSASLFMGWGCSFTGVSLTTFGLTPNVPA